MNIFVRSTIYLLVGLVLVVLSGIANVGLGWSLDFAWLFIVAAAFAHPVEVAPLAGLLFGLTMDSLSGGGTFIYTISYGGFGLIILLIRRAFFLGGFIPSWIIAVVGAEVLWLFMLVFTQAIIMLGGAASPKGLLSPFLLSTLILYPPVYMVITWLLRRPVETPRRQWYPGPSRTIKT